MIKIKRALLSVSDKTGIVELAKVLQEFDCEIISTGGTKKVLEEAKIKVTDIQKVTGNPEAFGGRMKTISFNIESALLFDRVKDREEANELGIEPIDMVVCNLYPFAKVKESGADFSELIENIDIGGPTMIRAAAKNFKYVAIITNVKDYNAIIFEMQKNNGIVSYETRSCLMRKAFNHTANYDSLIATTIDEQSGKKSLRFHFDQGQKLRYGENSHQEAFFYWLMNSENSLYEMQILHGKELSYNNIVDIQSAIDAVKNRKKATCVVVKHNNPCGLAEGNNQKEVFETAWQGDPISAFGSIIAFNRPVNLNTIKFLQLNNENKRLRKFVEVVVAPDYTDEALDYLKFHKNLRIIIHKIDDQTKKYEYKFLEGSLLIQTKDTQLFDKMDIVTENKIDLERKRDLIEFGLHAARQIKSNSIVIVRETKKGVFQLLGMGAGQPNRLISTKLAIEKAKENLVNEYEEENFKEYFQQELGKAILVSDAFFPFADNIEIAAKAGIRNIIQPGGSIKDKAVIKKCNELGLAMVFTGIRHFKH